MYRYTFPSPIGSLTLCEQNNAIVKLAFDNESTVLTAQEAETGLLKNAAKQLDEHFAGIRTAFDLPLHPNGTEFQRSVWSALTNISYGQTKTYGAIAREIMNPNAARAVGNANNRNPIPIIIPCHRVIGASGDLVGYGGGLQRKQFLIDVEQRIAQQSN